MSNFRNEKQPRLFGWVPKLFLYESLTNLLELNNFLSSLWQVVTAM